MNENERFAIVALGASAGGLGALDEFFTAMPETSGMAFVVVTHMHRGSPSVLGDLLGRRTAMDVVEVSKRTVVERDHVYVPRPGCELTIVDGVLHPAAADARRWPMPVDLFFRSLARDQQKYAVGIVLSGTGSDGTLGLKEIKSELGMVLAQDEKSAQYPGMPSSAAATELVDFVLPANEMPSRLLAYQESLHVLRRSENDRDHSNASLDQIFTLIRKRTGHDFTQYKVSTMRRRIERRMNLHHLDGEPSYVDYLLAKPVEVDLLFKELLIGVTSFFRDPDAWVALGTHLAALLADKPEEYVFRAWLAGCSTGEEAYSLAILLRELVESLGKTIHVQIFATDLDASAIDIARLGRYPAGIASDVASERLERFFVQEDSSFRVKQEIREMVVFAPQNLVADPPFTKLDLLFCRNLLIYLEGDLQRKLIPIFHYALKRGGQLFLGSSEAVSHFLHLFSTLDKKWKLFERRDVPPGTYVAEFPAVRGEHSAHASYRQIEGARVHTEFSAATLADRVLLRELVPPTIIVHEHGEVVHIHGRTGLFLEPAPGSQNQANVFDMARDGLQVSLAAAIRQAIAEDREVVHRSVEVKGNGYTVPVDLRVRRLKDPEPLRGLLRISFVESSRIDGDDVVLVAKPDRIAELERELQYTRETQQSTFEQLETANEELKSTNEEMQSTNEELQSTNEELETSKEEMQSLNEELQTVNVELQDKVEELSRANNDMKNLLNGTNIATIFLDNDLNIKRYTDQATKVIRLIPSDVGRPIGDLVSTLHYDRLVEDAGDVLRTLAFKETEVRGEAGAWYLMRILPYRTVENVIDGLVLTFVDITIVRALEHGQRRLLDGLRSSLTRVSTHDVELRYTWASDELFGCTPGELEGRTDDDVFGANAKELSAMKRKVCRTMTGARNSIAMRVDGVERMYQVSAEPVRGARGELTGLLCVTTELTRDVIS